MCGAITGEWWDTYEYRVKRLHFRRAFEEDEFELFVMLSQYMQAEWYPLRGGGQPAQSVANWVQIIWQFKRAGPNVSCTRLVDYYMRSSQICTGSSAMRWKGFHISMRYDKLVWKEGEVFEGMPFVHDDTREDAREAMTAGSRLIYLIAIKTK